MRLLLIIALLFNFNCYGAVTVKNVGSTKLGAKGTVSNIQSTKLYAKGMNNAELVLPSGLTFYKDFTTFAGHNSINADFSLGNYTGTLVSARSSSAPASYCDDSGILQVVTTENVGRFIGSYYDLTGKHSKRGLLIEGAIYNLLAYSNGTLASGGVWTGWNVADPGSICTKTNPSASSISVVSSATTQRLQYDGDAVVSGSFNFTSSTAVGSVTAGVPITFSTYLRSQGGISGVNFAMRFYGMDANSKSNWGFVSSLLESYFSSGSTEWKRMHVTDSAMADRTGTISAIDDNGAGVVTVATAAAHGMANGSNVSITGTTNFNEANVTVTSVADGTHFTYSSSKTGDAEATGTWTNPLAKIGCQFYIYNIDTGDTFDIEIYAPQVEKNPYPSTWVSTAGTSLQRPSEILSYKMANNRTANTESIFIKCMPEWNATDLTGVKQLLNNDYNTSGKREYYITTSDIFRVSNTGTGSGPYYSTVTNPLEYVDYTISSTHDYNADVNLNVYINGTLEKQDSTDFTATFGTDFNIGSTSTGSQFDGVIEKVGFFNRVVSGNNFDSVMFFFDTRYMTNNALAIGDSITLLGVEYNYASFGNRYMLVGPYGSLHHHAGVGGERSDQIETRTGAALPFIIGGGSKVVLLHVGTNDIDQHVATATIVDNVEDIIDIINTYDPNIKVYVSLIIPSTGAHDADITAYNTALNTMLLTYKASKPNLYIVDMNSAFKANGNWAVDYMANEYHPNATGHALMAQTWNAAMTLNGD